MKKSIQVKVPAPINQDVYHHMINEVRDYAIIMLDNEGVIIDWNKGAENIKGYTRAEALGKRFTIFYTEEDQQAGLPDELLERAKTAGSAKHEGFRVKKDGTKFWGYVVITAIHNDQGALIGFAKVTRDLTEKKEAEDRLRSYALELEGKNEQLRQSEERYHRMISQVEDYAIILLDPEGNVLDWNAGAEAIKGYDTAEIIGKNFRIFYTQEDREQKLPEMLIELAIRRGKAHHEGWRVRKDGTRFWGSITITALYNTNKSVIGFSKVTRDLTERKIAEDRLKTKNAELEEMNKELAQMNSELSSFAYISSHDLQEPLRKIQTFSNRIIELEKGNLSEKGRDYFARIQAASQRMRLLIDDLLTYSRASTAERNFEPWNVERIAREVLFDLETSIEETKAKVSLGNLPVMNIIRFQFHQLFHNLIGNSLKFAREGVPPEIQIDSNIIRGHSIPNASRNATELFHHIVVTDNGIGFDQQHSTKIFEVFQRLHGRDEYSGTGVGLAICKKIVENHYGIIRAEGRPGAGATIHMYIPVDPRA